MSKKYNIFKFKYGKEKRPLKELIKIGAILHGSLDVISLIPGVEKRRLFNFIDEIQLRLNIDVLNDYIIKDEELLRYRIDRNISKAIDDYENL
jgi:hypothetical protein